MKLLRIITALTVFSILCPDIFAQQNSSDLKTQEKLWRRRNVFKPDNVSKKFIELYKKTYNLQNVELPFHSFSCLYSDCVLYHSIIQHHENCLGDQIGTPIAMISSDKECIVYIQVLSQYGNGWLKNDIDDMRKSLALEVRCNKEGLGYWQGGMSEEQVNQIFNDNIKVYENDAVTDRCNADALFLCHFPCRENISIVVKTRHSIHDEYAHFYTLVIYRKNAIPLKMNMFLTDTGAENIDRYLTDITSSLSF